MEKRIFGEKMIRKTIICGVVLLTCTALRAVPAYANPAGGTVSAGSAAITASGSTETVTQSTSKAVINWQSFNIAPNETTKFIQPSSSSVTLNRIGGGSPSAIFGHLSANGNVVLLNPSGVLFGQGSRVDVNGLVATTANISDKAFMAAGPLAFNQPGNPTAAIENDGTITAAQAGLVGFVAPNVINNGIITAKLGKVQLASGDGFTLDFYGDGLLNVGVSDAVQKQLVANNGIISAAGGTIELTAAAAGKIVNSLITVQGMLSAPAVAEKDGHIYIYAAGSNAVPDNVTADKGTTTGSSTVLVDGYLLASGYGAGQTGGTIDVLGDNVGLLNGAVLDASGDAGGGNINIGGTFHGAGLIPTALNTYVDQNSLIMANANTTGDGGHVAVWSDGATTFAGDIMAEGGRQSGNGGYVETSGHGTLDAAGYVDLSAPNGDKGTYLLDPTNISIYGNFAPNYGTVIQGDTATLASSLQLWLDASNTSSVTLSYNTLGVTATGAAGQNTITTSSDISSTLQVGERVQIGSSASQLASVNDTSNIYTIKAISGTAITLDANLASAASSATLYGGFVSQLNDLSGNASNATQSTPANMPLWISNGQNGLGVLSFNGSNRLDSIGIPLGTFFVSGMRQANSETVWFELTNSGAEERGFTLLASQGPQYVTEELSYLNSLLVQETINNVDYVGGVDNTSLLTSTYNTPLIESAYDTMAVQHSANIAFGYATPGWVRLSGIMNGFMDYSNLLSTNARNLIEQYQSAKWDIALTGPGVIGSETGLTGTEAQQAMASTQAGATTDGYSVFTANYLNRLSQTSNIILDAGNNINLDLQGATLNIAAGKSLTLTAGNQITTASSGAIATGGGAITLNAVNGVNLTQAMSFNSGGGMINLNTSVTFNPGVNQLSLSGQINGGGNLTLNSGMNLNAILAVPLMENEYKKRRPPSFKKDENLISISPKLARLLHLAAISSDPR